MDLKTKDQGEPKRGSHVPNLDVEANNITSESEKADESCSLLLSIPIVIAYLLLVSSIVTLFDWDDSGNTGLNFGNSFYFSFLSLSTIGLGDVMPNNIEYSPLLAILFLFGLALLGVVNSTVYGRIQGRFLDLVNHLEEYLESLEYQRHSREGYFVFRSLSPNIKLLALVLPLFPEGNDDDRGRMHEIGMIGQRLVLTTSPQLAPSWWKLHRSHSVTERGKHLFQPTLGILNTASSRKGSTIQQTESDLRKSRARAITVGCLEEGKSGDWGQAAVSGLGNKLSCEKRIYSKKAVMRSTSPIIKIVRRVKSERINSSPAAALEKEITQRTGGMNQLEVQLMEENKK